MQNNIKLKGVKRNEMKWNDWMTISMKWNENEMNDWRQEVLIFSPSSQQRFLHVVLQKYAFLPKILALLESLLTSSDMVKIRQRTIPNSVFVIVIIEHFIMNQYHQNFNPGGKSSQRTLIWGHTSEARCSRKTFWVVNMMATLTSATWFKVPKLDKDNRNFD